MDLAGKKAQLLHDGKIFVERKIRLPVLPSKSSAGPGTGNVAIAIDLGGTRVKLTISREPVRFSLMPKDNGTFDILDGEEVFIEGAKVIPTLLHAPEQAFVNIETRCRYRCLFCNTWKLEPEKWTKNYTLEKWAKLIIGSSKKPSFHSVAVTTAVPGSIRESNENIWKLLDLIKDELPQGTPIGVEPCIEDVSDILEFKKRGVTEIKINVQAANKEIFDKICPGMDYERNFDIIREASKHMNVCSNIIVGLGESDEDVQSTVERLAKIGCSATIRGVRVNDGNRDDLTNALGFPAVPVEPERLVRLARAQKEIFNKFNIDPTTFHTMCHRCLCCDVVPFVDV